MTFSKLLKKLKKKNYKKYKMMEDMRNGELPCSEDEYYIMRDHFYRVQESLKNAKKAKKELHKK